MTQLNNYTIPYNAKFGWVDQPNQRGTIDIIWSCLLVIFTSTWTVLHINVPAEGEGFWTLTIRKARWAGFAIFAPEAVTLIASCQRSSARSSISKMHEIGVHDWSIAHAFLADSGGYMLHSPGTPSFPINSRAIHYLVRKKYVTLPPLSEQEIWDKSKSDRFAKAVALIQSTYMFLQCIARPIQSLDLSCFELVTVSFVACTAVSYYFWMSKPLNVEVPVHVETMTDMATILREAGYCANYSYIYTPMDFVEQPGWLYWKRRDKFMNFGGLERRPIPRVPNDLVQPPLTLALAVPMWMLTISYAAIHVAGWNYSFPTSIEVYVWRCSSVTMFVVLFLWGLVEVLAVKPGFNFTITLLGIWEKRTTKNTFFRKWAVDGPATLSAMSYFVARTVLVAETLASMRLMPGSVYQTVQWTNFLPHF